MRKRARTCVSLSRHTHRGVDTDRRTDPTRPLTNHSGKTAAAAAAAAPSSAKFLASRILWDESMATKVRIGREDCRLFWM